MIKIMKFGEVSPDEIFARVVPGVNVEGIVTEIIENVKKDGDKALLSYCEKFDKAKLTSLQVTEEEINEAVKTVDPAFLEILEKAADNATVDIPDCMVDREVQYMMQNMAYQLAASGLKMDDYFKYMGTDREKMEAMYRPDAKQRVKTELVIEAIKKAENVVASDAEIDEAIEKYAQQNGMPLDQLKENLRDDDKAYFADQVCANKIVDMLVETAVETDEEPAEAPKAAAPADPNAVRELYVEFKG